ncbi:hypothetical protein, partial [Helicobacter cinaedi]
PPPHDINPHSTQTESSTKDSSNPFHLVCEKQKADSNKHTNATAEVFLSDFSGFQAKGEGSYLKGNDRALSAESAKSTKKTTQNLASIPNVRILEISSPLCSYENLGSLKYEIFLQNCIGDYLLFMDLKTDSIADCLSMLSLAQQYDMVIGTRKNKKQNILQKLGSKLFYKTLALFANKAREDYSEFCVISRKVIHTLLSHKHDIKLLRLLHFDTTLNICEYPYTPKSYPKRKFLDSLFLGLDVIFGESYKLLRLGTCMCLLLACGNAFYALYILSTYFLLPHIASGWTSTSLYMVAMNIGLFLMLSIIGEYVRIALIKLKGATPYEIVNETSSVNLNFENKNIQRH